jgi:hypothetical protein
MKKPGTAILILSIALILLSHGSFAQVKDSVKEQEGVLLISIPKQPKVPPTTTIKFNTYYPPKSIILTQDDFKDYTRTILSKICREVYEGAKNGKINIYKTADLKTRFSRRELKKYGNIKVMFPIRVNDSLKKQHEFSIIALKEEYDYFNPTLKANVFEVIFNKAKPGSNDLKNVIIGIKSFSLFTDSAQPEKEYFLKGIDLIKIISNVDRQMLDSIISYSTLDEVSSIIIDESLLGKFAHKILGDINFALYRGVIGKKAEPLPSNERPASKYTIEEIKKQNVVCETVSIQIDPNDPYNTKDSTFCREYNPVHIYSGIKLEFNSSGLADKIAPMMISQPFCETNYHYMFYLKSSDAMFLLNADEKNWMIRVLFNKMNSLNW